MVRLTFRVCLVLLIATSGCIEQTATTEEQPIRTESVQVSGADAASPATVTRKMARIEPSSPALEKNTDVPAAKKTASTAEATEMNLDNTEVSPEQLVLVNAVRELNSIITSRKQRGTDDKTHKR